MANPYFIKIELPSYDSQSAIAGANDSASYGGSGGSGKSKGATYGKKSASSVEKAAKSLVSYSAIKGTADRLISARIGQVELTTGAAEYEQRLQSNYNIASSVLDGAVSLGVGIATGTWPIVLLGMARKLMSFAIGVGEKQTELRNKQSLENISISMASSRAGVNGRRSATQ